MNSKIFLVLFVVINLFGLGYSVSQAENFKATATCKGISLNGEVCRAKLIFNNELTAIPAGIINNEDTTVIATAVTVSEETDINICVTANKNLPISDLEAACTPGSFVSFGIDNTTANAKTSRSIKQNHFLNRFGGNVVRSINAILDDNIEKGEFFFAPGADYIVASLNIDDDSTGEEITIEISGSYCPDGVYSGEGDSCIPNPPALKGSQTMTVEASSTNLFHYDGTGLTGANNIVFSIKEQAVPNDADSEVNLYINDVNYPISEKYQGTTQKSGNTQTIYCNENCGEWFLNIENSDDSNAYQVTLNVTVNKCPVDFYGPNCNVNTTTNLAVANKQNKTAVEGTLDDEQVFDYYKLTFGNVGLDDFVRVSASRTSGSKNGPTLYIRENELPSPSTYDMKLKDKEVNQGVFQYNGNDWFVAVGNWDDDSSNDDNGNNDDGDDDEAFSYAIWAGPNCASLCSGHGSCMCNGANCTDANMFNEPNSNKDSFGQCTCDEGFAGYDCDSIDTGSSSSGFWTTTNIIIIAVVVVLVIILIIALAAGGFYFYQQKKQRSGYESV